jgi:phosphinothricin acetyltransferase
MTRRYETLTSAGFPYIVATLDGVVAGYAYAGPYRARPAYRFSVENSIYLDPAAQGKRIGTQLLQALITASETRGYRLMVAVIGDSANAASIGVHSRAGFTMVGTLENVGLKFGRWLDTVLMQRPLGEGAGTIPK